MGAISKGGYATYVVRSDGPETRARLFGCPADEPDNLSGFESEVKHVVLSGFGSEAYYKDAVTTDPFKVAERVLADHYGRAEMVEANYVYKPGIIY